MLTRQREFLQWICGGVATSALIVGGVWMSEHQSQVIAFVETGSLDFSSTAPTKAELLNTKQAATEGTENKGSGGMTIALSSGEGLRSDGSLTIQAHVTAAIALTDLKYEWVLPEGVTLAAGALNGDLSSLTEGASTDLSLTVSATPQANSQVRLHVYRLVAGEKVGQIAHYNTLDQPVIDQKMAMKRESMKSELLRSPASDKRRFE